MSAITAFLDVITACPVRMVLPAQSTLKEKNDIGITGRIGKHILFVLRELLFDPVLKVEIKASTLLNGL
jgi:hypothetical protein